MSVHNGEKDFGELNHALGYAFADPQLQLTAFRHASYVNEQADPRLEDNERLEFLGDAVLDVCISHFLMERFKDAAEGVLSKFRAMVVGEAGLHQIAMELGLGRLLLLGKGEEQGGGREKPSILANTVEALIGALYLDAGFDVTLEICRRLFASTLEKLGRREMIRDYKSLLQEYTQQIHKALPQYRVVEETGPAHDKSFRVALLLKGAVLSEGVGKSKKEAEQTAAREAFHCLQGD
jgi:ribonuclease III